MVQMTNTFYIYEYFKLAGINLLIYIYLYIYRVITLLAYYNLDLNSRTVTRTFKSSDRPTNNNNI